MILAIANDGAIGKTGGKNGLPWDISEDFKHFVVETKKKNEGDDRPNILVMGPKTFNEIGKPLPGRETIILSAKLTEKPHPDVEICKSPYDLMQLIAGRNVFVTGGKGIYLSLLLCATEIILTRVHADFPDADCFIDEKILLEHFVEQADRAKTLREQTSEHCLVTAHYYQRKTPH